MKALEFKNFEVRALLRELNEPGAGKTQSRRPVRLRGHARMSEFGPSDTPGYDWHFRDRQLRWHDLRHKDLLRLLPYQVDDLIWIQEPWRTLPQFDTYAPRDLPRTQIWYDTDTGNKPKSRRRQSKHMPIWASRITLRITDVRLQRVQDISEEDAVAEGFNAERHEWWQGFVRYADGSRSMMETGSADGPPPADFEHPERQISERTAREAFHRSWMFIVGPSLRMRDDWALAITYRPITGNVEQVAA